MSLAELIERHRIVVCVGSGGVGKTTTAAAIGLYGAMAGRRAMVLTIDPARRLAQALGLARLKSGGEKLDPAMLRSAGIELTGSISAGMLDQGSAWDEFITRHAPTPELCRTILDNEFYRHLSRSFAGSAEYMAIEELARIDESGAYDLIILDTPPTGHALDFLEAPRRLESFLDRSIVGWLVKPYMAAGWSAWKTASRTVRFLVRRVEQATGIETLREISEFFVAMERLFDGITERSRTVRELLAAESTAFLLVAGPEEQVLGQSEMLASKMRQLGVVLKGVVMNRVHPMPAGGEYQLPLEALRGMLEALAEAGGDQSASGWLARTYHDASLVAHAEAIRREAFEAGLDPGTATVAVPELDHDVHKLADLVLLIRHLCPGPAACSQ